jgi:hypothetical protein
MYAGNFPMTWGVDNDGNPETGICDESGFGQGSWRVCLGDSAGATNTWRGHTQLVAYITHPLSGGSSVDTLSFPTIAAYVDYTSHGSVTNAQALYNLFNSGGTYAAVDTGDYIFLNQGGAVRHGFLIVGWGDAVDAFDGLNARLTSESGTGRQPITTTKTANKVPYVADFAYGYNGTETGWLQDVRPRPFYATAVRINAGDMATVVDPAVIGLTLTDYQARMRGGAFNPFIFNGDSNLFPAWEFIHLPSVVIRPFEHLHCPL